MADLVDTHLHLDDARFAGDRDAVIGRARDEGLLAIITMGTDLDASREAVALAERYPIVYAAVGVHPHDAHSATDAVLSQIEELHDHPKVVAVGEIGLDFYRDYSPRDDQRRAFETQLALAKKIRKPVVIHNREADEEIVKRLGAWAEDHPWRAEGRPVGVMHCFSGSIEMAERCQEFGFMVSLAGPVTFQNARLPREVARAVPMGSLLVETDAPYLTPHPHRGKRNEPAYVRFVAQAIAEARGASFGEIARRTTGNAVNLFGISLHRQN